MCRIISLPEKGKEFAGSWKSFIDVLGNLEDKLRVDQDICKHESLSAKNKTFSCCNPSITLDVSAIHSLLKACHNFPQGKYFHGLTINTGVVRDKFLCNLVIQMYGKCGALHEACHVFDRMNARNCYSWNILITGYVQHEYLIEAHKIFQQMPNKNVVSWTSMISAYAQQGHFDYALQLFQQMPERNVVSWNIMIAICAKQGHIEKALQLFQQMPERNIVSWNSILSAYAQQGYLREALELFTRMPEHDAFSWNTMIASYAHLGQPKEAMQFFEQMPDPDIFSWSALISAFTQIGQMTEALELFKRMPYKNVVSWTSLISGYAKHGELEKAIELFTQMPKHDITALNIMITAYAQNGNIEEAYRLFQEMQVKNLASWNAMISALVQDGQLKRAISFYHNLQFRGMKPNQATFASIIDGCATQAALTEGKELHSYVIEGGLSSDSVIGTSLISMYSACGSLGDAIVVFYNLSRKTVVVCNAMITAYAQHGYVADVLHTFDNMKMVGTLPDEITYLGLFTACTHAGQLCDGSHHLISMTIDYALTPLLEHWNSMCDLVGRAGWVDVAEALITNMPWSASYISWKLLLSSCRIHKDMQRAKRSAKHIFNLHPESEAGYALLSNAFAQLKMWDDVAETRRVMKARCE